VTKREEVIFFLKLRDITYGRPHRPVTRFLEFFPLRINAKINTKSNFQQHKFDIAAPTLKPVVEDFKVYPTSSPPASWQHQCVLFTRVVQ